MNDDFNPYAPPKVSEFELAAGPASGGGVWRDRYMVMLAKDATLPQRCLKCNEPTDRRLFRRLYWHPPWIYVVLVISPLIYVIVALIVQKSAKVYYPICAAHLAKRRWAIAIGWLVCLLAVPVMIAASSIFGAPPLLVVLIGFLMFIAGAVVGAIGGRIVKVHQIDKWFVWLEGVDLGYLDSLTPLPGTDLSFVSPRFPADPALDPRPRRS